MIPETPLVAALARKGFTPTSRRAESQRLVRRADDRHDHVLLELAPASWLLRLARRPRSVVDIVTGVVWPIGEQAFARPVPAEPPVPQQVHAATGFSSLCEAEVDPATAAAAVDDWCRRLEEPLVALRVGAISEPIRRLEFAVVTSQSAIGREAAEAARRAAEQLPPARREREQARIDLALDRLPST
ncbi:hypothetical protein [Salsipaludibacter albus]|uniref:hypothetical protein n=1 Tax=Salsipaludibacter albus TaxID=2849650 RepID=UPI001EE421C9|nr:hypothetical protein [Salsipaludibacter albus]MBY5163524.1 hypothetical protein [Salsipaludibacter albus]